MTQRAALRTVSDGAAEDTLVAALRARSGEATGADLEVATGLGHDTVERTMSRLLDRYESRLAVAKGGALIYRFEPSFRERPERRAALRAFLAAASAAARGLSTAARLAFQIVLTVQLFVYTFVVTLPIATVVGAVVGVVVLIITIFTSKDGADLAFAILSNPYVGAVIIAVFVLGGIGWVVAKEYEIVMGIFSGRGRELGKKPKHGQALVSVVTCVNDFAVGPRIAVPRDERIDRTMRMSLADERLVLARVRAAGGKLRSGDLVRWLGLDLDEADRQATRLAVEHDGTPSICDLAVIEFEFPGLLDGTVAHDPSGKTAFERGEVAPHHTGNRQMQDLVIVGFALINLGAGLAGTVWLSGHSNHPTLWSIARFLGGSVPIAFSIFLLTAWMLRWPLTWIRASTMRRRSARALLVRKIVGHCDANRDAPLDLRDEDRELARALGGDTDLPDLDAAVTVGRPRLVWRFGRLAAELAPRAGAPAQVRAAEVVYET